MLSLKADPYVNGGVRQWRSVFLTHIIESEDLQCVSLVGTLFITEQVTPD